MKKRERTQISKIKNLKSYNRNKRSTKECKRQLQAIYANKMESLEEMDKCLERYSFIRMNQKQIENMSRPITSTEIETVVKYFQQTQVQDQVASQVILLNI